MGASDTTEKDWEEHWRSEQLEEAYQQGRADAIDEFVKAFKNNMLKSTTPTWTSYVEEIAEQLKEQNNLK